MNAKPMKVLLSIRPEYASRIFDGSKQYEYRRSIFKSNEVTKVVVYVSKPVAQVVGEFDVGDIICERPRLLWVRTGEYGGISKEKFLEYFKSKQRGYAIEVKEARKYETPFPLSCLGISTPPQSFAYLW